MNKKRALTFLVYLGVFFGIIYVSDKSFETQESSLMSPAKKKILSTFVSDINYFKTVDNFNEFSLKAKDLLILNNEDFYFSSPDGVIYRDSGQIEFESNKGEFAQKKSELTLQGEVSLHESSGGSYSADSMVYNTSKEILRAQGNTKSKIKNLANSEVITLKADRLVSYIKSERAEFLGNVEAVIDRVRSYEGRVEVKSNKLKLSREQGRIDLEGDVSLKRNKYYLSADSGELFLENFNKKLKYYVLYDDIVLTETLVDSAGNSSKRFAYGGKLEGFMNDGKIILTGAPRVEQAGDLIKGYRITLRENVEVVEVDDSQTQFNLKGDPQ